jgi:hypothetical protein
MTKIDYREEENEVEEVKVAPPVKMETPLLVDVEQENSQVQVAKINRASGLKTFLNSAA